MSRNVIWTVEATIEDGQPGGFRSRDGGQMFGTSGAYAHPAI